MGGRWTPAADEILRGYAARGHTSRQVAEALGLTKNAIIGRADRIGIKFAPSTALLSQICRLAASKRAARP